MASVESICSLAMVLLKRQVITSINDLTIEATTVESVFDLLRDELLESYAWSFAIHRAPLALETLVPANQYAYQYALPADCLVPLELRSADIQGPFAWVVEGRSVLTNVTTVYLKYIRRVTQTGTFTPTFCMALAYRIAATLAYPMTGKASYASDLFKQSDMYVKQGEFRDARSGGAEEYEQHDDWDRRGRRVVFPPIIPT